MQTVQAMRGRQIFLKVHIICSCWWNINISSFWITSWCERFWDPVKRAFDKPRAFECIWLDITDGKVKPTFVVTAIVKLLNITYVFCIVLDKYTMISSSWANWRGKIWAECKKLISGWSRLVAMAHWAALTSTKEIINNNIKFSREARAISRKVDH